MKELTIYAAVGIYFISTSAILFLRIAELLRRISDSENEANYIPEDNSEEEKLPLEWFLWAAKGKIHPDYLEYLKRKKLSQTHSLIPPKNTLPPRMRQIRRFKSPPGW
jgi:hypothetical protein